MKMMTDEISENDEDIDDIWKCERRTKDDTPFTKDSGPNIPDTAMLPIDIFFCLFPTHFVDLLVEQTNIYTNQQHDSSDNKNIKVELVTKKEMLTFLAVNILMGIKKLPSYRDYWSLNYQLKDSY